MVCRVDDLAFLSAARSLKLDLSKIDVAFSCLHSSCLYWNINLNVNLRVSITCAVRELKAERCRVSAAPGSLDHGGTAVQCGLFLFSPSP